MRVASALTVMVALALVAVVVGCEREDEIRSYQAPKDVSPARTPVASVDPKSLPASSDAPTWTVPAGWTDLGGQEPMRFAAFTVSQDDPTALVTVVPLGPESGELLPNVIRWETQVGLPPSKAEDLPKVTKPIDLNGVPGTLIDLKGPQLRTIAALVPRGQRVWFFKFTGNVDTVARHESSFHGFLESVRFNGGAPRGVPASAGMNSPRPTDLSARTTNPGDPQWSVPEGWVQDPDRPMRFATFRTSQQQGAPEVVVSSFAAGGFGNMLDNINRWRNMVGLEPVDDESKQPVEKMPIAGAEASVYDLTGPAREGQAARRLVLAMVPAGEQVWFFRLIGDAEAVEEQKANFDAFLKSVKFGE